MHTHGKSTRAQTSAQAHEITRLQAHSSPWVLLTRYQATGRKRTSPLEVTLSTLHISDGAKRQLQIFALQTTTTLQKGSIIWTSWTPNPNLNTEDFQQGCRLQAFPSYCLFFQVNAPLLQSAHCVLSTASSSSSFFLRFLQLRSRWSGFLRKDVLPPPGSFPSTQAADSPHLFYSTSAHDCLFCSVKKILEVIRSLTACFKTQFLFIFFFQEKFIGEVQAGESGIVRKTVQCTSFYLHLKKSTKKIYQKKGGGG